MPLFRKKKVESPQLDAEVLTNEAVDFDEVMKKYDKESNIRIWEGTPKKLISIVMSLFSLYCIWSTLFSTAALEIRLTAFLGGVIIMG